MFYHRFFAGMGLALFRSVPSLFLVALPIVLPPLIAREATAIVRIPSIAVEVQMVMAEEEFTTEMMVLDSETFLDRYQNTPFIRIQFAVSPGALNAFLHDGIENRGAWAAAKKRLHAIKVHYGKRISMSGNAVHRNIDGLVIKTIVIRGQNPLIDASFAQQLGGKGFLFAENFEKEMQGVDVLVCESLGLFGNVGENTLTLAAGREIDGRGCAFETGGAASDLPADGPDGGP